MDSGETLQKQLQKIAAERGGSCLVTDEQASAKLDRARFECAGGHVWEAKIERILKGSWCPKCSGKARLTIEDARALAKKRGGDCLSVEYSYYEKLRWRCQEGHEWMAMMLHIKHHGTWCPECSPKGSPRSIEYVKQMARDLGGECLSHEYKGVLGKLRWRCGSGHDFEKSMGSVQQGYWCPYCSGSLGTLAELQEVATSRAGRCLSQEYRGQGEHHEWECAEGHRWQASPSNVKTGTWCPTCARRSAGDKLRGTLGEYEAIAKSRGGACLSTKYVNSHTKLLWRCACGHEWMTKAYLVKHRGSWCPRCAQARVGFKKAA